MEYAQPTPVGEEVVMPDGETQCWELYEADSLIPLGEFAREAGFTCTVLITPSSVRLMAGGSLSGPASQLADDIVLRLREVLNASKRCMAVDAFVYRVPLDDGDFDELLVRHNFESREPFVLITERD